MHLNPEEPDNLPSLDGFISDDHKHVVRWQYFDPAVEGSFPGWWCVTHEQMYYDVCINEQPTN